MTAVAVEFKNVCKHFPEAEVNAVSHVSLKINQGEFITILGTSGSGKTTLMKMVNRLHDITSGDIFFFGENIDSLPVVEYRRKIGYVVQQGGLFPHMTVAENIAVVPHILKWDKEKIDARVDELLEMVGLKKELYRDRYPRQLSGGQQQRIGIARAMASDPAVMLMDEPFGAIDAITRENLQDELLRIQKALHKTILFVTHDISEAFKLGDRVIVMHEGKVQQFDTPDRIMLHPANDFVAKFVSADDVMKKLQVLKVHTIMDGLSIKASNQLAVAHVDDTLETLLKLFMTSSTQTVLVKDDKDKIVGEVSWHKLSAIAS
jgi:osmoprotectant transport system ATP-binding protein